MDIKKNVLIDDTILFGFENDYITQVIEKTHTYYEEDILKKFSRYIDTEGIIYDIGANIGNHTAYFYRYFRPKYMYSFEPVKETYSVLEKNVQANTMHNIELFNVAVGVKEGKGSVQFVEGNMGGASINQDEHGDIQIINLDSMGLQVPTFIKIDVEGSEANVIQGMTEILKKSAPVIWIEIFKGKLNFVNNMLNELGYELVTRVEENCIYMKAETISKQLELRKDSLFNILNYYEPLVSEVRKKYKESSKQVSEYKEKLIEVNGKYKQVTAQINSLKIELEQTDSERIKHTNELQETINYLKENEVVLQQHLEEIELKLQEKESENEILVDKILTYLDYMEELISEKENLISKRKYLLERNEYLYQNNQNLIEELRDLKNRYRALSNSKLGKITKVIWKLKKKIKKK